MKQANKNSGFTLIEVLIVVGIIAILAIVLLMSEFFLQFKKGRDSRRKQELVSLQKVFEDYYNDTGHYPDVDIYSFDGLSCETNPTRFNPAIGKVPCDPQYSTHSYLYATTDGSAQDYRIYAQMENEKDPDVLKNPCGTGTKCVIGTRTFNYVVTSPNTDVLTYPVPQGVFVAPSGTPGNGSTGAPPTVTPGPPVPTNTPSPTITSGPPTNTPVPTAIPTLTPPPGGFPTCIPDPQGKFCYQTGQSSCQACGPFASCSSFCNPSQLYNSFSGSTCTQACQ